MQTTGQQPPQGQDGPPADEERRLVECAVAGDARAFAALCERHRQRVWRVAASVTRSAADADDLAQEAFVRAFGAIRSYRPEASFAAWLCRIALNAAHDHQKSAWRRRVFSWGAWTSGGPAGGEETLPVPGDSEEGTPHREAERREVRRRVRAAVSQLKPREAAPIWMIYFEEFTLAEVARLEGEPESTVRSRVRAGLRRLEKSLGDLRPFEAAGDAAGPGGLPAGAGRAAAAPGPTPPADRLPDKRDDLPPFGQDRKGCVVVCR